LKNINHDGSKDSFILKRLDPFNPKTLSCRYPV